MTRTEHLLTVLAEECAEVAQRTSKALRFGINEIEPDQPHTNAQRIFFEMVDLMAVYGLLEMEKLVPAIGSAQGEVAAKVAKVEKYLAYAQECGTLSLSSGPIEASGGKIRHE